MSQSLAKQRCCCVAEPLEGRTLLSAAVEDLMTPAAAQAIANLDGTLVPTKVGSAANIAVGTNMIDHGPAVPISVSRGAVATVDGAGRDVFLMWMMDHRGGYSIIEIDVLTGSTQQFNLPFANSAEDAPYASILSTGNKFYTHFGSNFVEFDPVARAFTFSAATTPTRAMSMTQGDDGTIWSVTNPSCGVVSFNPTTRVMHDYGSVYTQNFSQYPYSCATDSAGWLYIGIGTASSQIVAFNPATGTATTMLTSAERQLGSAYVYRNNDGKVYGQALKGTGSWMQFYQGVRTNLTSHTVNAKKYIAGDSGFFYGTLASGRTVVACNVVTRVLSYNSASGSRFNVNFNYVTEGGLIMSLIASPDGTITGGGAFPLYQFIYNPTTGSLTANNVAGGQWNAVTKRGTHVYAASYPYGELLDWDTTKPWTVTRLPDSTTNPKSLTQSLPTINRPGAIMAYPNSNLILLGGTPDYGLTGGGMLIYNTATGAKTLLTDTQLVVDQSPASLAALPNNRLLIGTTVAPGTGGVQKATKAELAILNLTTNTIEWHGTPIAGTTIYTGLYAGANGLIYGFANNTSFFCFDPVSHTVLKTQSLAGTLSPAPFSQGPKLFVDTPNGTVYVLLTSQIARIDFTTNRLTPVVTMPTAINVGGDYLNGRIYFTSDAHLVSWAVSTPPTLASSAFTYQNLLPTPHRVTLTFSQDVGASLRAADLTLTNTTTSQAVPLVDADLSWNAGTNTATLSFTQRINGMLADGDYTLTLNPAGITNTAGQALTGTSSMSFFVLSGDANHDRVVNFDDMLALSQNYGQSGRTFSQGDFDYSGSVTFTDLLILAQHYNQSLAVVAAVAGPATSTSTRRRATSGVIN